MSSNLRQFPAGSAARLEQASRHRESLDAPTDLGELIGILRARITTIGAITLLFLAAAFYYILTTPTSYKATVSVIIDTRGRPAPTDVDTQVGNGAPIDTAAAETQMRVMSSPSVIGRVVDAEKLADDPEFISSRPGLLARLLGNDIKPPPADPVARRALAIDILQDAVVPRRSERSYVVDIDVSAREPEKARRLADAVAKAYLADLQSSREQLVERDMSVINQRLSDLRTKVDETSRRVADFRAQNGIADANGRNILEQQLLNATDDLTRARDRMTEAKTRYEQIQRLQRAGRSTDAVGDALKSPAYERLRGQLADLMRQQANLGTTLGARHPAMEEVENQIRDVRRLLAEEIQRIGTGAANEYQVARDNEAESARRVEELRKSVEDRSQTMLQLRGLEREAETTRAAYDRYLKVREANSEGPAPVVARVIVPASTPTAPAAPRRSAALAVGLFAGLFTGAVVALAQDFLGRSGSGNDSARPMPPLPPAGGSRAPRGVGRTIPSVLADLPTVVAAPARTRVGRQAVALARDPDVGDPATWEPSPAYMAAVDDLWSSIDLEIGRRGCVRVLVTSFGPGTGKTLFAMALARTAARAGVPTLLIDSNPCAPAPIEALPSDARPGLVGDPDAPRVGFVLREPRAADLCIVPLVDDEEALARRARRNGDSVMPETARLVIYDGATLVESGTADLAATSDAILVLVGPDDEEELTTADPAAEIGVPAGRVLGYVRTPLASDAA